MKVIKRFRSEPAKPTQQPTVLNKPYIPAASKSVIKEDKWYIQERGKAVEVLPPKREICSGDLAKLSVP